MDIRRPILPIPGAEAVAQVQSQVPDRQRHSASWGKREKRKAFPAPENEEREETMVSGRDEEDASPESARKGRAIEMVVDDGHVPEDERIQGSRLDVLA